MKAKFGLMILAVAAAPAVFASDGAALYKAKCAACHGPDGKGQTTMGKKMNLRDLGSPEVQKQSDKELYDVTANGKGKMPGYKDKMTDADIKALVACMRTMKH